MERSARISGRPRTTEHWRALMAEHQGKPSSFERLAKRDPEGGRRAKWSEGGRRTVWGDSGPGGWRGLMGGV